MWIFSKITFNEYDEFCESENYGRVTDLKGDTIIEQNIISTWSPDYKFLTDINLVVKSILKEFEID